MRVKYKIRRVILFVLMMAAVVLSIWFVELDPPAITEKRTGAENYCRYNRFVMDYIQKWLDGILPDELPERAQIDYEYRYHCALLGGPEFVVRLEVVFEDSDLYVQEKERLRIANMDTKQTGTYFLNGSYEDLSACVDEEVFDGRMYNFGIVRFEEERNCIGYCVALLEDAQGRTVEFSIIEQFVGR